MKFYKLKDFTRGWVVGDFEPSILRTKDFEFAVQYFKSGQKDQKHVHKVAREISIIVSGEFTMNGKPLKVGDVIEVLPGDTAEFVCLKDGATAVIKTPSVKGDKYITN